MSKSLLLKQYRTLVEGEPWHGEGVKRSFERISLKLINAKPDGVSHSMASLIDHIIKWRYFAIEKLKGNQEFDIEINSADDWNDSLQLDNEEHLEQLIEAYSASQNILIELIESLDEGRFNEIVAGRSYSLEYLIWGILYHDVYHQGQINLLHAQLQAR